MCSITGVIVYCQSGLWLNIVHSCTVYSVQSSRTIEYQEDRTPKLGTVQCVLVKEALFNASQVFSRI